MDTMLMEKVVAVCGLLDHNVMDLRKVFWTATALKLMDHSVIQLMWESSVVVSYKPVTSFLYLILQCRSIKHINTA